jgi:tripartite-type tricarboxylate transporter receptor subunit TctC
VASFYRGKTVHIIVGTVAGGTFDRLARLAARFMPKYIPGNPNIIVENMESAGGRVSANHLYNAAPKDGTVLATFNPGLVNAQLMGEQGVQYDATKFNWVGSLQDNHMACYVNSPTGVKSLADLMGPTGKELKLGAQAPGSGGYDYMALMKELGAKIRIVSGYEGSGPIYLAMEQGELDGTCLTWEATSASRPDFFEGPNPKLNVFIQFGGEKVQALPTVPHISEFVKTDEQRALVNALSASEQIQRPLALPPGVPTDRVLALRKAFNDLVQDPELLAEVKRTNDALAPKTGEQVEQVVTSIMNTPRPLVDELKRVIQAR